MQPRTSPQPTKHLASVQVWYGVPAHASEALEEAMRDALPHLFEAAPSLMYQLVTMLSPTQLKARGVPVCRLVHQEGSFVITFPNAYHAGFNTGGPPAACAACLSWCRVPGRVSCEWLWTRRERAHELDQSACAEVCLSSRGPCHCSSSGAHGCFRGQPH